jgi:hypothetical protein
LGKELDAKKRFSNVAANVKQLAANYNLATDHSMWLGMAVSSIRARAMVKRPARGQEKDF